MERPLRVVQSTYEPLVYPCAGQSKVWDEETCPYPGICPNIFHYAADSAGFKYEIVPYPQPVDKWGDLINETSGEWDGLLGMVQNGTFDTIASCYSVTKLRSSYFKFTFPLLMTTTNKLGFITRRPMGGVSLESTSLLYKMFHPGVWASFGGLFLTIMVLLTIARNYKQFHRDIDQINYRKFSFSAVWDIVRMAVDQFHGDFGEGLLSANLLMVCAGFLCLFLHTMYEGYLVTMMLNQQSGVPFKSTSDLAELIANRRYRMASYGPGDGYMQRVQVPVRNSKMHQDGRHVVAMHMQEAGGMVAYRCLNLVVLIVRFQSSSAAHYTKMREAFEKNPPVYSDGDMEKLFQMLNDDGSLVFAGVSEFNAGGMLKNRCNLTFLPDDEAVDTTWSAFVFRNNSTAAGKISQAMAGMIDLMQVVQEKHEKFTQMGNDCSGLDASSTEEGKQALQVKHYYAVFILFAVGVAIATAFLLFEILYFKTAKKGHNQTGNIEDSAPGD